MALYLAIEKAASIEGSQRALAKRLGIRENYLSDMKHGLKPCTVANRVKIAQIAGVDPKRAAVEGLIDQLDDSDEIQKGAKTMLQSMLAAFPERTDESQNPEQEGEQGVAQRPRERHLCQIGTEGGLPRPCRLQAQGD